MICPCKGCENNGCGAFHDQCEPYQQWQKDRRAESDKRAAMSYQMSRDHELKYRRNLKRGGLKK